MCPTAAESHMLVGVSAVRTTFVDGPTVAVIVTYGRRAALLRKTLECVTRCPELFHIIIVDNGSLQAVDVSDIEFSGTVSVLRSEHNLGSAGGFGMGIAAALQLEGTEFLTILDDDNLVEPTFLTRLVHAYRSLKGISEIALCALREDRPQYQYLLKHGSAAEPRANAFLGFHVCDVPRRFANRLRRSRKNTSDEVRVRAIRAGPYGGLFMTIATAKLIGTPRDDFVLYGDDHEYTQRLTGHDISLYLTDLVRVRDAEQSWNISKVPTSPWFAGNESGWRQYYAARNHVFLERSAHPREWIYRFNRVIFTARLALQCLAQCRSPREVRKNLRPFTKGVSDGFNGELGYCLEFPIPGARP